MYMYIYIYIYIYVHIISYVPPGKLTVSQSDAQRRYVGSSDTAACVRLAVQRELCVYAYVYLYIYIYIYVYIYIYIYIYRERERQR